jgi:hypothetical protein
MAFPTGWISKAPVVIDYTKVGVTITDFPLLLTEACLPAEMLTSSGVHAAQSNGGDIRFSSDANGVNGLNLEIEIFTQNANPALAKAALWVRVPSASHTVNTTIYVWYQAVSVQTQPAASDATYGSYGVWSTFAALYHLNAIIGGTTVNDSTANAKHGTLNGTGTIAAIAAKIAKGIDFPDGTVDNYILLPSGTFDWSAASWTVSGWFNIHDLAAAPYPAIASCAPSGSQYSLFSVWNFNDGYLHFDSYDGGSLISIDGAASSITLTSHWYHGAIVNDAGTFKLYLDGAISGSPVSGGPCFNDVANTVLAVPYPGLYPGGNFALLGTLDEVRFSITAFSAERINTEFKNQNNPGTFATAGTPVRENEIPCVKAWSTGLAWA